MKGIDEITYLFIFSISIVIALSLFAGISVLLIRTVQGPCWASVYETMRSVQIDFKNLYVGQTVKKFITISECTKALFVANKKDFERSLRAHPDIADLFECPEGYETVIAAAPITEKTRNLAGAIWTSATEKNMDAIKDYAKELAGLKAKPHCISLACKDCIFEKDIEITGMGKPENYCLMLHREGAKEYSISYEKVPSRESCENLDETKYTGVGA